MTFPKAVPLWSVLVVNRAGHGSDQRVSNLPPPFPSGPHPKDKKCPSGCRLQAVLSQTDADAAGKIYNVCEAARSAESALEEMMSDVADVYRRHRRSLVIRHVSEQRSVRDGTLLARKLTSLRQRSLQLQRQLDQLTERVRLQVQALWRAEVRLRPLIIKHVKEGRRTLKTEKPRLRQTSLNERSPGGRGHEAASVWGLLPDSVGARGPSRHLPHASGRRLRDGGSGEEEEEEGPGPARYPPNQSEVHAPGATPVGSLQVHPDRPERTSHPI
ncbi:uncharacterized protein LOC144066212 isoform X1 [Stigmatopora argus]